MKKLLITSISMSMLCLAVAVGLFFFVSKEKQNLIAEQNSSKLETEINEDLSDADDDDFIEKKYPTTQSITYIIKAYKGKVAVFEEGTEEPCQVTDLQVSGLTEFDQKSVEKGIKVKSESELLETLQDFCS